jgi:hypothetical protein
VTPTRHSRIAHLARPTGRGPAPRPWGLPFFLLRPRAVTLYRTIEIIRIFKGKASKAGVSDANEKARTVRQVRHVPRAPRSCGAPPRSGAGHSGRRSGMATRRQFRSSKCMGLGGGGPVSRAGLLADSRRGKNPITYFTSHAHLSISISFVAYTPALLSLHSGAE